MKKVFHIILILACVAIVVSGIPGWISGGGNGGGADGSTVVSVMFHVSTSSKEGQAYKRCVDSFNEAYKDKKIKAQAMFIQRTGGASAYETAITSMKNKNQLPDIIAFDSPKCSYFADKGILYDITRMVEDIEGGFISSSINRYDGKIYGLPIQESSAGFYYNKSLFAKAGITEGEIADYSDETPWTYEEFKYVCERLKAVTGDGAAVDMRFKSITDETAPFLLYPFVYASGGEFCSEDGRTVEGYLNGAGSVSAFKFFKELLDSKYTDGTLDANDFYTGRSAMYLSSGWEIADLKNKNFSAFPGGEGWGLLPYPYGADGKAASANGSWSLGITVNHHTDKTAARELLKWLVSDDSSRLITDSTGMISAKNAVNEGRYEAGTPEALLLQQLNNTGRARPAMVGYAELSTTFNQIIMALRRGDKEVQNMQGFLTTTAQTLQKTLNEL